MDTRAALVDDVAHATSFSGAVRLDERGELVFARAYGAACRAHAVANRTETQFAIASGTKGLTALTVLSLVADGTLALSTPARAFLNDDLAMIDAGVTVEQLLCHRSGIGDYVDEDADFDRDDYVLEVPVHRLIDPEHYVPALDGIPAKFAPGTAFSYCNSGFVLLALLAERAARRSFYDLVQERVCAPAGMTATAFLRADALPPTAALGYLDAAGDRTNVLHLPVRGCGDGGVYTTLTDVHALWAALLAGRVIPDSWVAEMRRDRRPATQGGTGYGLGVWLPASEGTLMLEGCDAGVSFRSVCDPNEDVIFTVVSNTTDEAWPVAKALAEAMGRSAA